ncbi:MAG: peptidase [Alphaproteobacteria bacterium]|nr:peptidase [Alphaproteobacteria bacterium]
MAMVKGGCLAPGLVAISAALLTTGCGGSGGTTPVSPPPSSSGGPVWTSGVYAPSSQFKNKCQTVRTGVDIEGNPYPDTQGSTLYENFWLRSWTHETYLWNNEVVDRNPANYSDPVTYFGVLKTTATTASGKPKDQFHFSLPTDEFLKEVNSAPSATYGASFHVFSATVPRDVRVQYTEPGSPAAQVVSGSPNMIRGDKILEIDGVDAVNANTQTEVDMLNAGLFPATAGETHTFKLQDPGGTTRTISMMSTNLAFKPVNRTAVVNTSSGDVGYILLNTFSPYSSEKEIADAITAMKNAGVSDLVIDLRYNGGGLLAVASELGYEIAGAAQTNGKVFEAFKFNADAGNLDPTSGQPNQPAPFFDTGLGFSLANGTPLDSLNLSRVFILTTGETCSASEAVINALRGINVQVVLVGGTTCGKPYGFYPQDNCGETYFTIQFQGVNDMGFGDFADGFAPANSSDPYAVKTDGCAVADDYNHDLGDSNEALLAAALQYRQNGSCPTPPPSAVAVKSVAPGALAIKTQARPDVMKHNLDMRMPN